jgi:hypothetical protein
MSMKRRRFLRWSASAGAGVSTAALTTGVARAQGATDRPGGGAETALAQVPASIRALRPMTDGIVPINAERLARLDKARQLRAENNIGAICLEGGSSGAKFFTQPSPAIDKPFA